MDKSFILILLFQLIGEVVGCGNGVGSCFYYLWYFWFGLFWLCFGLIVLISYCCRKYKQRNQVNAAVTRAPPPKPSQAPGPPPYTAQSVPPPAYSQTTNPPQPQAQPAAADPAYPPGVYPPPPPATYNDPAYPPRY